MNRRGFIGGVIATVASCFGFRSEAVAKEIDLVEEPDPEKDRPLELLHRDFSYHYDGDFTEYEGRFLFNRQLKDNEYYLLYQIVQPTIGWPHKIVGCNVVIGGCFWQGQYVCSLSWKYKVERIFYSGKEAWQSESWDYYK